MPKAVLVVSNKVPEIIFQDDDVDVFIFDLDSDDTYLYKNNLVCKVVGVDLNGMLTIRCIDALEGSIPNRSFIGVDPSELDLYESGDSYDDCDD